MYALVYADEIHIKSQILKNNTNLTYIREAYNKIIEN